MRLKELLDGVPDGAAVEAYDGVGVGLFISYGGKTAWIETPDPWRGKDVEIVRNLPKRAAK